MLMQEVSQAYARHFTSWKRYLAFFARQISRLLEKEGQRFSLKYRVKSLESLSEKITFLKETTDDREVLIKDLLGLRVVVPFQEGVDEAIGILKTHYDIEEIERKSERLSYREFAYDSVHLEIPVPEDLKLPSACKAVFEVQVRTILQDAWAEVEHELIYKNHFRFPNSEAIRKKLAAVNASLTLSDMIFQEIRDSQKEKERWGHARFQALIDKSVDIKETALPGKLALSADEEGPAGNGARQDEGRNTKAEIEKYLMKALQAHNEQDYAAAIKYYTMVLERNPELQVRSVVFSHRGMANFMLQQESQALSDFDRSYYCDQSNFRSLNYRALVLRRMGYVEQALECFSLSLKIRPKQPEVYFLRAQTLSEIDQPAEALSEANKALEMQPDYPEAQALLAQLSGAAQEDNK